VAAYFTLTSVANHLPVKCFWRHANGWKWLGLLLPTRFTTCDLLRHNCWEFVDCPQCSCSLTCSDFYLFGPLKNIAGLVSNLWLMPTWSMLSPSSYRHLTPIFFFVGIQALVPWCNKCLNVVCGYVKVWSAPFAMHVTCGQQSQNKVWASGHELLHCLRMYCIPVMIM
jgi:hypothetical protein